MVCLQCCDARVDEHGHEQTERGPRAAASACGHTNEQAAQPRGASGHASQGGGGQRPERTGVGNPCASQTMRKVCAAEIAPPPLHEQSDRRSASSVAARTSVAAVADQRREQWSHARRSQQPQQGLTLVWAGIRACCRPVPHARLGLWTLGCCSGFTPGRLRVRSRAECGHADVRPPHRYQLRPALLSTQSSA